MMILRILPKILLYESSRKFHAASPLVVGRYIPSDLLCIAGCGLLWKRQKRIQVTLLAQEAWANVNLKKNAMF